MHNHHKEPLVIMIFVTQDMDHIVVIRMQCVLTSSVSANPTISPTLTTIRHALHSNVITTCRAVSTTATESVPTVTVFVAKSLSKMLTMARSVRVGLAMAAAQESTGYALTISVTVRPTSSGT